MRLKNTVVFYVCAQLWALTCSASAQTITLDDMFIVDYRSLSPSSMPLHVYHQNLIDYMTMGGPNQSGVTPQRLILYVDSPATFSFYDPTLNENDSSGKICQTLCNG